MALKLIPQNGVMGKRLSPPLLFGFFYPQAGEVRRWPFRGQSPTARR